VNHEASIRSGQPTGRTLSAGRIKADQGGMSCLRQRIVAPPESAQPEEEDGRGKQSLTALVRIQVRESLQTHRADRIFDLRFDKFLG
jgi:hypothetical protein